MTEAKEEKNSGKATGECTELQEQFRNQSSPREPQGLALWAQVSFVPPGPVSLIPAFCRVAEGWETSPWWLRVMAFHPQDRGTEVLLKSITVYTPRTHRGVSRESNTHICG